MERYFPSWYLTLVFLVSDNCGLGLQWHAFAFWPKESHLLFGYFSGWAFYLDEELRGAAFQFLGLWFKTHRVFSGGGAFSFRCVGFSFRVSSFVSNFWTWILEILFEASTLLVGPRLSLSADLYKFYRCSSLARFLLVSSFQPFGSTFLFLWWTEVFLTLISCSSCIFGGVCWPQNILYMVIGLWPIFVITKFRRYGMK